MIITEKIKTKVGTRTFQHFRNLGYEFESLNDEIEVNISDLNLGSHTLIDVRCDYCNEIYKSSYKNYCKSHKKTVVNKDCCFDCRYKKLKECNLINFGYENVFQNEKVKEKSKETNLRIYGFENAANNPEVKAKYTEKIILSVPEALLKRKETNMERYGMESVAHLEENLLKVKATKLRLYGDENYNNMNKNLETRIILGTMIPDDQLTDWEAYRRKVRSKLTKNFKKELYDNWDGYDYYDGEYIKDNLNLSGWDRLSPSIDHKVSIFDGFTNNIPFETISSIDNICITKRHINSSKNSLSEDEYNEWLNRI